MPPPGGLDLEPTAEWAFLAFEGEEEDLDFDATKDDDDAEEEEEEEDDAGVDFVPFACCDSLNSFETVAIGIGCLGRSFVEEDEEDEENAEEDAAEDGSFDTFCELAAIVSPSEEEEEEDLDGLDEDDDATSAAAAAAETACDDVRTDVIGRVVDADDAIVGIGMMGMTVDLDVEDELEMPDDCERRVERVGEDDAADEDDEDLCVNPSDAIDCG